MGFYRSHWNNQTASNVVGIHEDTVAYPARFLVPRVKLCQCAGRCRHRAEPGDDRLPGSMSPGNNATVRPLNKLWNFPGTQLVITQQNLSRRITAAQYRATLISACHGENPRLQPSEPGARAEKGVEGLTQDVAPSLLWGRDHVDFLRERLAAAQRTEGLDEIVPFALRNLPERSTLPQSCTS